MKFFPKYNKRLVRGGICSLLVLLIGYSTFMMVVATSVKPEISLRVEQPYSEILLPSFYQGNLTLNTQSIDEKGDHPGASAAWNLGQGLGLKGLASLIPLGLGATVLLCWLFHVSGRVNTERIEEQPEDVETTGMFS